MNSNETERRYPDAVVFAVNYLLDKKSSRRAGATSITEAEREEAVTAAKILFPALINREREAWLRSDVARLTEDYGETLSAQNRDGRDQTIRGALR